jgi:hypothetical protein
MFAFFPYFAYEAQTSTNKFCPALYKGVTPMAIKNQALVLSYLAWDTVNSVGKTGDAANHNIKILADGSLITPVASPIQADIGLPGVYKISLTDAEMNYNCITLGGLSSTAGVSLIPVTIVTERGFLGVPTNLGTGGASIAGNLSDIDSETDSITTKVNSIAGTTFDTTTDSLEAIRNHGDVAWVTGETWS